MQNFDETVKLIVERAAQDIVSAAKVAMAEVYKERLQRLQSELVETTEMTSTPTASPPAPAAVAEVVVKRTRGPGKPKAPKEVTPEALDGKPKEDRPCPVILPDGTPCTGRAVPRYGAVCKEHKDLPDDQKVSARQKAKEPGGVWVLWHERTDKQPDSVAAAEPVVAATP